MKRLRGTGFIRNSDWFYIGKEKKNIKSLNCFVVKWEPLKELFVNFTYLYKREVTWVVTGRIMPRDNFPGFNRGQIKG